MNEIQGLLLALFVVCLIGQAATVYLVRRCLVEVRRRQALNLKLVVDEALIDEMAEAAADGLDARGVFAGERVVH